MSQMGKYKIPRPFKDEDKWFRFFTKKQLLYLFVCCFLAIGSVMLLSKIYLTVIGFVVAIFFLMFGFIVPRFDMPLNKYLWGGGVSLEKLSLRVLIKQLPKNKVIYIKM